MEAASVQVNDPLYWRLFALLCHLVQQTLARKRRCNVFEGLTLHLSLSAPSFRSHVGQERDIVHLDEPLIDFRFVGENIESGRVEFTRCKSINQGILVDDTSASRVDQDTVLLHLFKLSLAKAVLGLVVERQIERNDITLTQHFIQ